MNRKVFVVKGYSENDKELNLDRHYANNYQTYFNSIAGGAYELDEIIYLEDPTTDHLNDVLANFDLDFSVIILIGHGAAQDNYQLFKLNNDEIIKPGQIEPNSDKTLIIIESCRREAKDIMTVDLNDKVPQFKYGGLVRSPITREKSKELYIEQLEKCKDGIVICFACSKDETAINFFFSLVLIQQSFNWHLEHWRHFETLNINKLMPDISAQVKKLAMQNVGKNQTPEIIGNLDFPFAISKF